MHLCAVSLCDVSCVCVMCRVASTGAPPPTPLGSSLLLHLSEKQGLGEDRLCFKPCSQSAADLSRRGCQTTGGHRGKWDLGQSAQAQSHRPSTAPVV